MPWSQLELFVSVGIQCVWGNTIDFLTIWKIKFSSVLRRNQFSLLRMFQMNFFIVSYTIYQSSSAIAQGEHSPKELSLGNKYMREPYRTSWISSPKILLHEKYLESNKQTAIKKEWCLGVFSLKIGHQTLCPALCSPWDAAGTRGLWWHGDICRWQKGTMPSLALLGAGRSSGPGEKCSLMFCQLLLPPWDHCLLPKIPGRPQRWGWDTCSYFIILKWHKGAEFSETKPLPKTALCFSPFGFHAP